MADKEQWEKVESIVDKVLTLSKTDRKAYINKKCETNQALKSEVTLLLESISASKGWLDNPAQYKESLYDSLTDDIEELPAGTSFLGQRVGVYVIKKELGQGGMGSVYLAERSDGRFDHAVAIKIMKAGVASAVNVQRFKREQNILAGLSHPGIAKLFDGGVTEEGYPYLIMEYVDGIPINEFCDRRECALSERIRLFKQILRAISHAHENLVIHRDLKPGNIFVTEGGEVKILDFGISKLLAEEEANPSLTQTKDRLLTPKYAAPEQIKQQPITTATDLYSLGIIFYQLICGTHPFNLEGLSRYETEQKILHEHPAAPSRKVLESFKISSKALRGDLDAVALKAIRKEPEHRYRVTKEFLDDLNRYLKGLPVSAREGSFTYKSQKFIQRHKKAVIATIGIFLLIVSFATFYTWRITSERNQAQLEAQKANQIKTLLSNILQQSDPFSQPNRDITLREVLDQGTVKIEHSLENQPVIKAELLGLLGNNYVSLGDFAKGQALLAKSIAMYKPSWPESSKNTYITNLTRLGRILHRTGHFKQAESTYSKALHLIESGNKHNSIEILSIYNTLAAIYREQGILDKTEDYYNKAIAMADSTQKLSIAISLDNLGSLYRDQRKFKKAINVQTKSLDLEKTIYKTIHPNLASVYNNLAFTYQQKGDYTIADSLHQIALSMRRKLFPPDHPHIASSVVRLGLLKIKQLQPKKAEKYLKEGYDILKEKLPNGHWQVLGAKGGLAVSRAMQGNFKENIPIVIESFQKYKQKFGIDDWRTREAALAIASLYRLWGKPEKATVYSTHYSNIASK